MITHLLHMRNIKRLSLPSMFQGIAGVNHRYMVTGAPSMSMEHTTALNISGGVQLTKPLAQIELGVVRYARQARPLLKSH